MNQFTFKSPTRRLALTAAVAATLCAALSPAQAQPLSERPIKIIVNAPAGGTADFVARQLGESMSKGLGQPVVIDNKPGVGGVVAMESFLASPKDGHTYLLSVNGLATEIPHSIKTRYDAHKDVKPLVEVAGSGLVLVGNAALPPKDFKEMVAYTKAHPGKINFASYTPGTVSHVLGLQLNKNAGLDMIHVGYKGSPPALMDVMGGSVQFMFDGVTTSLPHIKAGKLRPYAVTSPQRMAVLPDVPTMAELGFKDMTRTAWMGLWTLPGHPEAAQKRIREEALKAMALPAVRDRLTAAGLAVNTQNPPTPEQLSKGLLEDYETVGVTLRSVNYKPE